MALFFPLFFFLWRHFKAPRFFHLSLSPEVGVYKVGLIDESSVNSLHLVRVWKSGEDVRKKKSVTSTDRERGAVQVKEFLPRKQAVRQEVSEASKVPRVSLCTFWYWRKERSMRGSLSRQPQSLMHLNCKDITVRYLDTYFNTGCSVIITQMCSPSIINNKQDKID